jgi:hypothetical protein
VTADQASFVAAEQVILHYLAAHEIAYEHPDRHTFAVILPGEHRLKTTVSIVLGVHSVSINAFVVRHPDENHAAVHQWLLERNRRMYGVAYAIDHLGDVYLVAKISKHAVTEGELDKLFGSILENSDGAFDHLLELGFGSAIKREWAWRIARGESTANLEAFRHLADNPDAAR